MKDSILSDAGDKWTVKLDTRDMEGHLDTAYRRRAAGFLARLLLFWSLRLCPWVLLGSL